MTLRSLVTPSHGGAFSGNLTGGNGRPNGEGQEQFYEFDVPSGVNDIRADVSFPNDPSDPVGEYLVSPDGDTVGYGQNSLEGTGGTSLSAYAINPAAGRWTLIVDFAGAEKGNEISQPYQGDVRFNAGGVSGVGVPNGRKIKSGQSLTVPVRITNTGVAPEDYFIDARRNTVQNLGARAVHGEPAGPSADDGAGVVRAVGDLRGPGRADVDGAGDVRHRPERGRSRPGQRELRSRSAVLDDVVGVL